MPLDNKIKISLLITFITAFISPWTWWIFSKNIFIGLCCVTLSLLLLLYFNQPKTSQKFRSFSIIFFITISIYLFTTSFDKNLFKPADNQYIVVLSRQEIYSLEFDEFYKNRFGILYFNKIYPFIYRYTANISNIFNLDGLFVSTFEDNNKTRFPVLVLPFMVIGFWYILKEFRIKYVYMTAIILIISGLLETRNSLGPIFLYSIICASIGLGFNKFQKLFT